jgi:propanol-preferring alcohol dehydrogenase
MSLMYANELDAPARLSERPLDWRTATKPEPADGQILIEVAGCGVCRSNLHMIEGEWVDAGVPAISPIVPGDEVTGHVAELGAGVADFAIGDPVGVQPLWWTCEVCEFCTSGREHLCHQRKITGEHVDGGYAEYMLSHAAHTYHVPENLDLLVSSLDQVEDSADAVISFVPSDAVTQQALRTLRWGGTLVTGGGCDVRSAV